MTLPAARPAGLAAALVALALASAAAAETPAPAVHVWHAGPAADFPAREVRRYVYLMSGALPTIHSGPAATHLLPLLAQPAHAAADVIVLRQEGEQLAGPLRAASALAGPAGSHSLQTVSLGGARRAHILTGVDEESVLWAAYSFAEALGVRFRPSGDVLPSPENRRWAGIPHLAAVNTPTFDKRGLQPFHDFASGPDWWSEDDYKSIVSQLAKMKMNFLGLHTYPYGSTPIATGHNEPTVWVGLKSQVLANGSVVDAYPTSYANTGRNEWGMTGMNTSAFYYGADQLFESECWGSPVQVGNCPVPLTAEGSAAVFDRTAEMLSGAFQHAHKVGIKTCVGTETPLSKPPMKHGTAALNLYYSETRQDSFATTTPCTECEGLYKLVRTVGYLRLDNCTGCVALSTYYNGNLGDNVLSTVPLPGYAFVRVEGFASPNSSAVGPSQAKLMTWYSAAKKDHLVTG